MAAIERLKKKGEPQISVALLRMKPMKGKPEMEQEDSEADVSEDAAEYGNCPKCAEYQMLIGEALAAYMKNKDEAAGPSED